MKKLTDQQQNAETSDKVAVNKTCKTKMVISNDSYVTFSNVSLTNSITGIIRQPDTTEVAILAPLAQNEGAKVTTYYTGTPKTHDHWTVKFTIANLTWMAEVKCDLLEVDDNNGLTVASIEQSAPKEFKLKISPAKSSASKWIKFVPEP